MISVENATFTYPGAPSPILTNVSFEVPEHSSPTRASSFSTSRKPASTFATSSSSWDSSSAS